MTSSAANKGAPSIHASAVLVGSRAVLIRGPSGSGKSRLALDLLQAADDGRLPFARLVADDRTLLEAAGGRLLARPAPPLAGLIEVRGVGIRHLPYEPVAVVFVVIDLAADAHRVPEASSQKTIIEGIVLPRLAVASGVEPLPLLLAEATGRAVVHSSKGARGARACSVARPRPDSCDL